MTCASYTVTVYSQDLGSLVFLRIWKVNYITLTQGFVCF